VDVDFFVDGIFVRMRKKYTSFTMQVGDPSERIRINIGLEKKVRKDEKKWTLVNRQVELLRDALRLSDMIPYDRIDIAVDMFKDYEKLSQENMKMLACLIIHIESGELTFKSGDIQPIFYTVFDKEVFTEEDMISMKIDMIKYAAVHGYI
jgi:hypothetical protein